MANAIQFTIPDDEFIELAGAGVSGSMLNQGSAAGGSHGRIVLVESLNQPTFTSAPNRFKTGPASFYLKEGQSEPYFGVTTIWAVSTNGDQFLSVTPSVEFVDNFAGRRDMLLYNDTYDLLSQDYTQTVNDMVTQ